MGKYLYQFYFLILFLVLSPSAEAQQYFFRRYYSEEGGLPQSQVRDVIQDKRGSLWVATDGGGIARFNGKRFDVFTTKQGLLYNQVSGLLEDNQGNIWYASYRGIGYYDGHKIKNIAPGNWFNDCHYAKLYQDADNVIWVAIYYTPEKSRLAYIQNGKLFDISHKFPELASVAVQSNAIRSFVYQGANKTLYIQTAKGIYTHQHGKLTFSNLNNIPGLKGQNIIPVLTDSKGQLWLRTAANAADSSGFKLFTWHKNQLTPVTIPDSLQKYPVTHLLEDHAGGIWVNFKTKGLAKYQHQRFTPFFQNGSIANFINNINKLLLDREKNIWLGTEGGLIRFGGEAFTWYNALDGLPSEVVSAIYQDSRNRHWFAMGTGAIAYLENGNIHNIPLPEKNKPGRARGIIELPNGEILLATSQGIWSYSKKNLTEVSARYALPINTPASSFLITGDTLWIGTLGNGVTRVIGKEILNFTTRQGLASNYIRKIQRNSKGTLWFCTDEGISYLTKRNTIFKRLPQFKGRAFQMAEDKTGQLWFATYGEGLLRLRQNKIKYLTAANGLSSDNLYNVVADAQGNIIVGTQQHLDKIELNGSGEPLTVTNYGLQEGFIGTENNGGAAYRDRQGKLWFGTLRGAVSFNAQLEKNSSLAPVTYITDVQLFYRDVNWLTKPYQNFASGLKAWQHIPENLRLPYKQNHIAFTFESSALTKPEKVQYSWFLEDIDRDWSPPSAATQAIYPDLPPGTYTFLVKSSNGENTWSAPAGYTFTIKTPYWRTWWFLLLLAILFIILLIAAVRYFTGRKLRTQLRRLEIEQKIHRERERIARDLHDNVGSQLAYIINSLDDTASENSVMNLEKSEHLKDFTKQTINQLRETIWAIRQENISIGELATRIEKFVWQLTQYRKEYKYQVLKEGPLDWKLSPVQALNLFRIAQEAITNSLKHSQATLLTISLKVSEPHFLTITISDDGRGFDQKLDLPPDHYGLTNMQERAKEIPASFALESIPGAGTTITLEVDLSRSLPDYGLGKFTKP